MGAGEGLGAEDVGRDAAEAAEGGSERLVGELREGALTASWGAWEAET